MQPIKKMSFIFLCLLLAVSPLHLSGCSKTNDVHVWSTYNTRKVMQSFGSYEDLGVKLDVLMAKGETEGAQLLITPEKDVKSAVLTSADLTDAEGNVLPASAAKVYIQRYIDVLHKTEGQENDAYPTGMTPDMLLPMDTAVKYGETSVKAGHNQGYTVEFTTTSQTKAGVYTGSFSLDCDGNVTSVPVTVEVADTDITLSHGKTMIHVLLPNNISGEYDNADMMENYYYTAMNDYRFMFDLMPHEDDVDRYVRQVISYWDHPHFTNYTLPTSSFSDKWGDDGMIMYGEMYDYMYALTKASTSDKILLEKAVAYAEGVDEVKPDRYGVVRKIINRFYEMQEKLIADLAKEGFFADKSADFRARIESAIRSVPLIQTGSHADFAAGGIGPDINTCCHTIEIWHNPVTRDTLKEYRANNAEHGGETWFYTCCFPIYPYPSQHLDDYLIGGRIMRWMQKDYDIDGYLHWSFDNYYTVGGYPIVNTDPYNGNLRQHFPATPGDGFMVYPGKKYGMDTFIPSLRLTTFRDGQEDYDLLCVLDEKIRANEAFYGLPSGTVSSDVYVSDLYGKLYDGAVYNPSDADFYAVRRELFDVLAEQDKESKLLLHKNVVGNRVECAVYLADGYELRVDGGTDYTVTDAGRGKKYEFSRSLDSDATVRLSVTNGGEESTRNFFLASKRWQPTLGDGARFTATEGSNVTYADGKATVTLSPRENASALFRPYVRVLGGNIGVSLNKVDTVSLLLTNDGDDEITVGLRVYSFFEKKIKTYTVAPHSSVTVQTHHIYQNEEAVGNLDNAYLELYIENEGTGTAFTISDLAYTEKRSIAWKD